MRLLNVDGASNEDVGQTMLTCNAHAATSTLCFSLINCRKCSRFSGVLNPRNAR